MYNKLFETLEPKEQNAVKFAFELVDKKPIYNNYTLVKLKANGTTGYPVYYLYMSFNKQGYVLRILKQGRKCKLMSFGNPKIVWAFVNDTASKMPTRKEATVESFGAQLKNSKFANTIIKMLNDKLQANITLQDFGITSLPTNVIGDRKSVV